MAAVDEWEGGMSKDERARLKLIRKVLGPAKIYELRFVVVSATEWAVNVVFRGGSDRRFRFTRGELFDEACIGDARV